MHKSVGIIAVIGILTACNTEQPKQMLPSKAEMMEMNRLAAKKESIQIQQFVDQQKWTTTKTGSGLHYYVYQHGTGDSAKTGMKATVKMVITLLNGDTCYSWTKGGEETFVVDYDHNESGLHEAIKKMRAGDKAKVILPSHLAFGVAGDFDKIPTRSSVVYDIELVKVQ